MRRPGPATYPDVELELARGESPSVARSRLGRRVGTRRECSVGREFGKEPRAPATANAASVSSSRRARAVRRLPLVHGGSAHHRPVARTIPRRRRRGPRPRDWAVERRRETGRARLTSPHLGAEPFGSPRAGRPLPAPAAHREPAVLALAHPARRRGRRWLAAPRRPALNRMFADDALLAHLSERAPARKLGPAAAGRSSAPCSSASDQLLQSGRPCASRRTLSSWNSPREAAAPHRDAIVEEAKRPGRYHGRVAVRRTVVSISNRGSSRARSTTARRRRRRLGVAGQDRGRRPRPRPPRNLARSCPGHARLGEVSESAPVIGAGTGPGQTMFWRRQDVVGRVQ